MYQEKTLIIRADSTYMRGGEDRVNKYLEDGWRVKSVTGAGSHHHPTVVYVLEKGKK